jgi:DNA mismatch repair ATPase MutS
MSLPIFYLQATISYTKGKQKIKREEWIVYKYDNAREIMVNDSKTTKSLEDRVYGKVYKGEKKIVIVKINSKKIIGYGI